MTSSEHIFSTIRIFADHTIIYMTNSTVLMRQPFNKIKQTNHMGRSTNNIFTAIYKQYTLHGHLQTIYSSRPLTNNILFTATYKQYTLHGHLQTIYSSRPLTNNILFTATYKQYTLHGHLQTIYSSRRYGKQNTDLERPN